jgi:tetratricopeptide (TPR) repeat protein
LNHFRTGFGLEDDFPLAHFVLGCIQEALGEYDAAVTEYERSQGGLGNRAEFIACVGRVNALRGKRNEAFRAVQELEQLSRSQFVQPTLFALVFAALEDKTEAFDWLEIAFAKRDEDLSILKVDPRWDCLRGDQKFKELIKAVGLHD